MTIFDYDDSEALGKIISVDSAVVVVRVDELERLKRVQVNRLVALQSSKAGQHLVGVVSRITRKAPDGGTEPNSLEENTETVDLPENNLVRVSLIGTLIDRLGTSRNVFRRTLETVPEIDANCFALEGDRLTNFMQVISNVAGDGPQLELGKYTLDEDATAYLNGNRLFQRHAIVVGSTGSGKSWTTARLLDQVAALKQANAILFDVHGEYKTLVGEEFRHFRLAGPGDLDRDAALEDGVLYLPYWLLGYEAMVSLFVDRSDQNAPNQAMIMSRCITDAKRAFLEAGNHTDILENFTVDSPVPFDMDVVVKELSRLDTERVPDARGKPDGRSGDFNGKLSRLIARFASKRFDRRLGFLFQPHKECMSMEWLPQMAHKLIGGRGSQHDKQGGIKIVDFSEVPSDILPLMVSLLARLIFTVTQWTDVEKRHPVALFCDEAHLYVPERASSDSVDDISVGIFERIAKEGRKYGVGLVVISQRPAEVNRTVLSQCNNVVAMRLTNGEDQSVIKRLLPDSLGSFGDLLPVLDVGEALVVGDASLLPTRVRVAEPKYKPNSATVEFWDRWNDKQAISDTERAVHSWRKQSAL
ncbi:ATP-binding protein [Thalassospira xiamenensis]|uniref:ATPase n=1 Tax=Thalassospira xiamenensis TaxID=220697 RepID=A0ABR5Y5Y4_9PROT|nr:ATP-binding protein [Thalassospira xiamenensis]KZD06124.1 ATPase [Thalassospira xiamenensis]KZD07587.1 ATPase [Thalassospira xiamenensis]